MDEIVLLVRDFGLPIALVLFFVWETKRREGRLGDRIDHLENDFKNELLIVVKQATGVIERNTEVIGRLERKLDAV